MNFREGSSLEGVDGKVNYSEFSKDQGTDTYDAAGIDWKIFDSKSGVRIRGTDNLKETAKLNALGVSGLTGEKLKHVREHGIDADQDKGILASLPSLALADRMLVTVETQRGPLEIHDLKPTDTVHKIYIKEEVNPKEELVVRGIIQNTENFTDPVISAVNEILRSGKLPTDRYAIGKYLDEHPGPVSTLTKSDDINMRKV